ncbi:MAG: hypothetical protein R3A13_03410 [Bdellovibrionota bacterium]
MCEANDRYFENLTPEDLRKKFIRLVDKEQLILGSQQKLINITWGLEKYPVL